MITRTVSTTALLVVLASCFESAAQTPESRCLEQRTWLEQASNGRHEDPVFHETAPTTRDDHGKVREERQLLWKFSGRDFAVDLFRFLPESGSAVGAAPPADATLAFAGKLRGPDAENATVVLSRLPSGAWEGHVEIGADKYILRARCDRRESGSGDPRSTVYLLENMKEVPDL